MQLFSTITAAIALFVLQASTQANPRPSPAPADTFGGISQKLARALETTKNNPAQSGTTYNKWEDVWNQKLRRNEALPWEAGVSPVLVELVESDKLPGLGPGTDTNRTQKAVLDVGCGSGLDALYFKQHARFGTVVGIDISPSSILLANENAANATKRGSAGGTPSYEVADFFQYAAQAEGQFDLLWDRGLYHNLGRRGGRGRYASAAAQLLKPGGELFLLAGAARSEAGFACPLSHFPATTRAELEETIPTEGLEVVSIDRVVFALHVDAVLEAEIARRGDEGSSGLQDMRDRGGCDGLLMHARRLHADEATQDEEDEGWGHVEL